MMSTASYSGSSGEPAGLGASAAPAAYASPTELGKEIAALTSIWRSLPPSASADLLAASIGRLASLDQSLIQYDAQVAAYSERCKSLVPRAGVGSIPQAHAQASPGHVPTAAAVGIGAIGILAGGVAGYFATKSFARKAGDADDDSDTEE